MLPFYQNFPFFCIFIALLCGICTTAVHDAKIAMRITLGMLIVTGILNAIVLFFTTANGIRFTYVLGGYDSPFGNELAAGPLESMLAVVFCAVMFLSVLGGKDAIFADVLHEKQNLYFIMLDMLLASLFALCYTNDMFTGYVFIEVNTIAACALVMARDCGQTVVATIRYLIMSLVGSGMFLFSLCLLYAITGHLLMPELQSSVTALFESGQYMEPLAIVAGMSCIGLSVKSALFPFHTWLPDAHGSGTTTSSSILSGLVLKGYIILLLKIFLCVFTLDQIRALGVNNIFFVLGVCAMIFGSVQALHENNCKRMIAYSSVAQIGYIYMGLGFGIQAGIVAAAFQIIAHAFTKPLLFVSAGGLIDASGHQKKLFYLRGAAHRNMIAGIGFTVGGLSMVGIPFFAGFITKSSLAEAALSGIPMWQLVVTLFALTVSSLLNALYYIPAIFQIWKGEDEPLSPEGEVLSHGIYHEGKAYFAAILIFIFMVFLLGCCYAPLSEVLSLGVSLL
ncbi:MAG: proton-conducting transporter membrane subunit [Faecalibacterium sp.]